MAKQRYVSRYERQQMKSQWRSAFFWLLLTCLVLVSLYFWGVPAFIKLAVWYGDWKAGESAVTVEDTVPPAPPRLSIPFTATSSAVLDLNGFAEPGSEVQIFLNQESIRNVTTDAEGKFLVTKVKLENGYNRIYAVAKDQAQNISAESRKEQIIFDHVAPKLTIEKPQSGKQFYGSGEKRIEVKGQTDADAQVRINDRAVIVDQNGDFYTFIELDDGDQTIKVVAVDEAKNETVEEIDVRYNP